MSGACKLFWADFSKRVIDHLTDEHAQIKRLRIEQDALHRAYKRQRNVLIQSMEPDNDLEMCGNCADFCIINSYGDNDGIFMCDCDVIYCDECTSDGNAIVCSKCETPWCSDCVNYCGGCKEFTCNDCGDNDDIRLVKNEEEGDATCRCGYKQYCSIDCVPVDKRGTTITLSDLLAMEHPVHH